jgi:hypothetical protein
MQSVKGKPKAIALVPKPPPSGALLTPAQVAALLQVSIGWIHDHVGRKQPRLPCVRLGRVVRFKESGIAAFIAKYATV